MCTIIQRDGPLPRMKAQRYSRQIAEAVMVLHSLGYCHLDLSLENMLYDSRADQVKVCGVSRSACVLFPCFASVLSVCVCVDLQTLGCAAS